MRERTQQLLWITLTFIALALSVATGWLYLKTRQMEAPAATAQPYRIVYVSVQQEYQGKLQSCDLQGKNVTTLTDGRALDAFPVCEPFAPGTGQEAHIAFVRLESDTTSPESPARRGGVYVMSAAGGKARKVSGSVPYVGPTAPTWSPDGKQLAFVGAEDANGDGKVSPDEVGVYVCDVATGQATRVVTVNALGRRLSWSPAGQMGIVPTVQSNRSVACLLDVATGKLTPILGGKASVACWSPDGRQFAAYMPDLHKIHILPNGGGTPYSIDLPSGEVVELAWTPAGPEDASGSAGRLWAVVAKQHGYGGGQLFTRSAGQGNAPWQALTNAEDFVFDVSVSPDGRYVTYSLFTGELSVGRSGISSADLYLLEFGQREPRRLTSDPGFEGLATWVPVEK